MAVGNAGKFFDVEYLNPRIADRLSEQQFGIGAEGCGDLLFGGILVDEGRFDSHFRHGDGEEVEGASVDGRRADNVVACRAEVEHRIKVGSLS